jgi:hypothetical protein
MADGFEIHELKDGRVLVVLHPTCAITKEAILALLAEMGIHEKAVIFLSPEDVAEHCTELGNVPVVIPVDQACCDAPELEAAGRQCGQAGGRVMVVFGNNFAYEGLHPIAEKYGNQCGWSASQLEGCANGPKAASPHSSAGRPITRPEAKQVEC